MTTETILLIVLIIVLAGALPAWPHSKSWGYGPSGVLFAFLLLFLVWAIGDGRPLFRSSGQDIQTTVQEAGQDIKELGRDATDSIRDTVQ